MANTFRKSDVHSRPTQTTSSGKGLFSSIGQTFKMGKTFENGVPTKILPHIIWTTILVLLYIANAHYTEKTIRKIDKLKYEVEELRTEYTTLQSSYMVESKQSKVADRVRDIGLVESKNPPLKIYIDN